MVHEHIEEHERHSDYAGHNKICYEILSVFPPDIHCENRNRDGVGRTHDVAQSQWYADILNKLWPIFRRQQQVQGESQQED